MGFAGDEDEEDGRGGGGVSVESETAASFLRRVSCREGGTPGRRLLFAAGWKFLPRQTFGSRGRLLGNLWEEEGGKKPTTKRGWGSPS